MPYPSPTPYELLDATTDDDALTLQRKRFPQASIKRRERLREVREAFDTLRNARTRLPIDILEVTNVPEAVDGATLAGELAPPVFLNGAVRPLALSLSLTDLAVTPEAAFRPIERQPTAISESEQYLSPPEQFLPITFDR